MRLSASEKYEIIQEVTTSEIGVKQTLESFGIARSTFYKWYQKYLENGYDGLETSKKHLKDNGIAFRKNKKIW
ncbi:helix-turn-helix domain-containing protein [Chryseobacterium sp. MYb264]|uniref:helix-turn-helix domain-containing protein n=1 Tax=Chryseobacterium sp. MYb264 TaxID=2745153 RepID=UPI002E0FC41F|nr:helix-turn-helix domain-containing protein [Chryseobacterium sp. MYb264]